MLVLARGITMAGFDFAWLHSRVSAAELLSRAAKSPDLRAFDFHVFKFAGHRNAIFGNRFEPVAGEIGASGIADQHGGAAFSQSAKPIRDVLGHVAFVGDVASEHESPAVVLADKIA